MNIFILARGGSKRIPGKNLINLGNKPLISYTIQSCLKITENVFVSSDSLDILEVSKKYGAKTILRPEKLAEDNSTSEGGLKHCFEIIPTEDFVLVQPTNPFVKSEDIIKGIELFRNNNYDCVFSVVKQKDYLWDVNGNPINFLLKTRTRSQNFSFQYKESGSFYISSVKRIMQGYKIMSGKVGFVETDKRFSVDIDEYEDLELAEIILKRVENENTTK